MVSQQKGSKVFQPGRGWDFFNEGTEKAQIQAVAFSLNLHTRSNRETVKNPGEGTATSAFDPLNRETTTTDPEDNVTVSEYDAAGNKTKETKIDPGATADTSTTYSFDSGNRMIAMTDALGLTTSYTVDAIGNQTGISVQRQLLFPGGNSNCR